MTLDKSIVFDRYTTEQCFEILRETLQYSLRPVVASSEPTGASEEIGERDRGVVSFWLVDVQGDKAEGRGRV